MFAKTKTKPTPAPTLRFDLREAEPAYDALAAKIAELKTAIRKLDDEESALHTRLSARSPKPENAMNSRVAEMLGEVADHEDPMAGGILARLTEINAIRRDTRAALAIAEERLQRARHSASKVICDSARAEYVKRVSALAVALTAAHNANAALYELTSALDAANAAWTGMLPPVPATKMLGAPYDKHNRVAAWLKDAAAAGLIDAKSIPEGLKP